MMKLVVPVLFTSFIWCLSSSQDAWGAQEQGGNCSLLVTVDVERGLDCSSVSLDLRGNLTCCSLSDALGLLSFSLREGCVDIVISQGQYDVNVNASVLVVNDVILRGRESDDVTVNLSTSPSESTSDQFTYSLSFRNINFAKIENIKFTGGNGVIGFDNVSVVEIMDSSFRNFTQGAVDIYNSHEVFVSDCSFANNGPVTVIKQNFPWRGHSGGLSVAFNLPYRVENRSRLSVVIRDCNFYNNSVSSLFNRRQTTSQLLQRFITTGRGGGCVLTVNSETPVDAEFERCVFEKNHALTYGGGLYLAWDIASSHKTSLNNITFKENVCPGGAGGLLVLFASSNELIASNLHFEKNQATFGGGMYIFLAARTVLQGAVDNEVRFEESVFEGNQAEEYGGAVGFIIPSPNAIFGNRDSINPLVFSNCSFNRNDGGRGGIVSTSYLPLIFEGLNTFYGNRGTALTIIGTLVKLQGHLAFINNAAGVNDGGALNSISLGQLRLANGAMLTFNNNSGNVGAGIVVNSIYIPQLFNELLYNPLCFLLLEDETQTFRDLDPEQISIQFSGNRAAVGAAVYTNEIGLCSWTGSLLGADTYFNRSLAFRWNFVSYSTDNRDSAHCPNDRNPQFYVQTAEAELVPSATNFTAYPGETVTFGISAIDDLNQRTISALRFTSINDRSNMSTLLFDFSPSVVTLNGAGQDGVNLSVLVSAKDIGSRVAVVDSLLADGVDNVAFSVNILPCPLGYALAQDSTNSNLSVCQCDLQNQDIINCNGPNIQIRDGQWASSSVLETYPCPYKYCRCHVKTGRKKCSNILNGTSPDSQCICNRTGILCGTCRDNKGFSALLNHCVSCSNISALLIIFLVIADCVVFTFLMLLCLEFPGWLFPCLLYLQILPYIAEHFPPTFENAHYLLYFISSASGFYFVYDFCLLNGLSPLLSYFFRYLPLFTAVLVCPSVLIVRYTRCRAGRVYFHTAQKWHGIWWIVVFLYSSVVYTSMTILNCPSIPVSSDRRSLRWYVSGDIECFKGYHLSLTFLALLILLACILVLPLLVVIAMNKTKYCVELFSNLSEVIKSPFRKGYEWWSAVELAKRFILILFIVAFPANNYPVMVIISLLIILTGLTCPYGNKLTYILEQVLAVDALILLMIRNTKQITDEFNDASFQKITSSSGCVDYAPAQLSTQSSILIPFYYFPVLVFIVAFCVWAANKIRTCVTKRFRYDFIHSSKDDSHIEPSPTLPAFVRAPTLTELNLQRDSDGDVQLHSTIHYTKM